MVLHHVFDRQRLHADNLVFVNQLASRLVQVVRPDILDTLMEFCQSQPYSLDVLRLLIRRLVSSVAQLTLNTLDLFPDRPVRFDVGVLDTIAVHNQCLDTKINANYLLVLRKRFDVLLDQQHTMILPTLVFCDRAVRDFFWYISVEYHLNAFQELWDNQFAVFDACVLWYTEGLLAVLVLERRELGTLLKKVAVGSIEVLDSVLQGLAVHFGQPSECFLEFSEFLAIFGEVIVSSGCEVFVLSSGEEIIVQVASAAEVFGKEFLLWHGREQSEPVCVLYTHAIT